MAVPKQEAAFAKAEARVGGGGFGTLQERTLHSTLKFWLQPDESLHEVPLGERVADVFDGLTVTEVQTAGLHPLKAKLPPLLKEYPVTVVVPIAHRKWVYWIDPVTGACGAPRRSPKIGGVWDALPELFWVSAFWKEGTPHPLTVRLLLLDMEEYRLQDGWGSDGKRGAHRADRRALALAGEMTVRGFADVPSLLPPLPSEFTGAELSRALGRRGRPLWYAVRFLEESGAIRRVGKRGRAVLYQKG